MHGFNLLELMVTLVIVGILVSIAIPSYQQYTKRAHYLAIVQATLPYKIGVEECFHRLGDLMSCQSGKFGIPPDLSTTEASEPVKNIKVAAGGKITITPNAHNGISESDTYILTPRQSGQNLRWNKSGGGIENGLSQ